MSWGCPQRACEQEPPSLQATLELADDVPVAKIQALEATVTVGGLHKVAGLATAPLKTSRRATFVVAVGEVGVSGFAVELLVQALGAAGKVLAQGKDSFAASGDACNDFTLRLTAPVGDGGPPDADADADADIGQSCSAATCTGCCAPGGVCAQGIDDTQCGKDGVVCVDCTKTGGTCKESKCGTCTPDCAGKACGAVDGCGGTCSAGSGCCASPKQLCGGACVDTSSDPKHCGMCNSACAASWRCSNGSCECDPSAQGSCSNASQFCSASSGKCEKCTKGKLNCDGTGTCECVGKCSGTSCDTSCTYGIPNQCGSIYHACTINGDCELCPPGIKNCDQQSGCGTPENDPCP